jgi:hypothetical protein
MSTNNQADTLTLMTDEGLNVRLWSAFCKDVLYHTSPRNYCSDANAVAEVFEALDYTQQARFTELLWQVVNSNNHVHVINAKPRPRTITLILTLTP